ncbi:unnamed protein product [Absidia cylindrospora]
MSNYKKKWMSFTPQEQNTASTRQSSNNPYKHVAVPIASTQPSDQNDSSRTMFMNFNTKSPSSSTAPSLEQSYTQRTTQSVNIHDFRSAFEQTDPLPPPPLPAPQSPSLPLDDDDIEDNNTKTFSRPRLEQQQLSQHAFDSSIYDTTDDVDDIEYSDTAKLTEHPADMAHDNAHASPPTAIPPPPTTIRPMYQPAAIESTTRKTH